VGGGCGWSNKRNDAIQTKQHIGDTYTFIYIIWRISYKVYFLYELLCVCLCVCTRTNGRSEKNADVINIVYLISVIHSMCLWLVFGVGFVLSVWFLVCLVVRNGKERKPIKCYILQYLSIVFVYLGLCVVLWGEGYGVYADYSMCINRGINM